MTSRSHIAILTVACCLASTVTCFGQSQNKKSGRIIKNNIISKIQFDTSKTAIIPFDRKYSYPFDKSNKPSTLTQDDIYAIDSLLIACVTDYNNSLDKEHKGWEINLKKYNYRKQLIVVTNKKGEKQVWVNCFCDIWKSDRWKTGIMYVDDGGNCYFSFKINLRTKKNYDLRINSLA